METDTDSERGERNPLRLIRAAFLAGVGFTLGERIMTRLLERGAGPKPNPCKSKKKM